MVDAVALLTMATVALGFLFVSLAFGSGISRLNPLAYSGVALLIGALIWLAAILSASALATIPFFVSYVTLYQQLTPSSLLLFGNPLLTAVFSIIGIIEVGMLGGYGIGRYYRRVASRPEIEEEIFGQRPRFYNPAKPEFVQPHQFPTGDNTTTQLPTQGIEVSSDPRFLNSPLSSDERTIAQLLLFGGVPEIKPTLDDKRSEGYYFEQLQSLDWDTKRQATALNGLAKRGFLNASPREKILHCRSCNSSNLEFRGACPECDSLALSKHKVLEHFSCGMIEKESAFRTPSGDLLCPKCNKKLELIGNDYRSLGLMYVCQNCGALSKDLSPSLKCRECGFSTTPDEEIEQFVFAYTLNPSMLHKLRQYVKPIEIVVNHYKSLGLIVYSPSFVRGKSQTEQAFDLMIQNTGSRSGESSAISQLEKGKTVADILVSDKPIDLEEITKEYGKISDVSYPSILFVVPSLSEKARSYASAYDLRIIEGRTIEQALANANRSAPPIKKVSTQPSQAALTQPSHD
jgi:predicted RNA-binding Zn-ribbon protein involved in translation (DUF1610 family)